MGNGDLTNRSLRHAALHHPPAPSPPAVTRVAWRTAARGYGPLIIIRAEAGKLETKVERKRWEQLLTLDNWKGLEQERRMARPIRVEYEGAVYHVTARGNERKRIYRDMRTAEGFLGCCRKWWRCTARVSMAIASCRTTIIFWWKRRGEI